MANYTENYDLVKPTMAETADIRTINGNMDTVDTIMHDTQVSMADAFDSTASYAIRDLVMYEFKLYQCIHPHEGPWDAENWVRVNAAETGGNYVEITPTYQSGLKIAETNIDGDQDEIDVPYFGGATAQENGTGGAVPAPTSSDVGKFLSSNGGWETPSGGGGGTTVVPNPVGEPAEDLETIQIGNIIYNIPGNGGGAGGSVTTLYTGTQREQTVSLSDNLNNYDAVIISFSGSANNDTYRKDVIYNAKTLSIGDNIGCSDDISYLWYDIVSMTSLGFHSGSGTAYYIKNIVGLNFGGSGKTSITTLYNTFINSVGEITLANNIIDYDFIMIDFGFSGTDKAHNYIYIPAEDIPNKYPYVSNPNNTNPHILLNPFDDQYARMIMGSANNKLFVFQIGQTVGIYGVYGIKCGSGGSSGGYSETDLFVNTGSTNPASIVMADSIQNYDEIVFCVTRNDYGNTYKLQFRYLPTELALGDVIQCWCWGPNNEYFSYQLTAYDTFSNMAQGNALLCNKIKGIKH